MLTTAGRRSVRAAIVAIVLVLAVAGAPLARVATPGCRSCAASCPMHRARLHCHDAGTPATAHRCHSSSPALAAPGCQHDADPTTTSLAPGVLPPRVSVHTLPRIDACVPERGILGTRAGEPPDTPPPIAS